MKCAESRQMLWTTGTSWNTNSLHPLMVILFCRFLGETRKVVHAGTCVYTCMGAMKSGKTINYLKGNYLLYFFWPAKRIYSIYLSMYVLSTNKFEVTIPVINQNWGFKHHPISRVIAVDTISCTASNMELFQKSILIPWKKSKNLFFLALSHQYKSCSCGKLPWLPWLVNRLYRYHDWGWSP